MPQELHSPELQAWAAGFPLLVAHVGLALVILVAACALHALISPHREIALIREGNAAAAISFSGIVLGLALPLAVSLALSTSIIDTALWGVSAVFTQLVLFRLTDLLLHGLPERVGEGEISAAVLLVSAKLATAMLLAAALSA